MMTITKDLGNTVLSYNKIKFWIGSKYTYLFFKNSQSLCNYKK